MTLQRIDIERALDEVVSQEEGMRFQSLAVVLGKLRWPELIACERKKDLGLDAYAGAGLTVERVGKGLASSITPTLKKLSGDAETAKKNFQDLEALLFVTSAKVSNIRRKQWTEAIKTEQDLDLHIISREDIITTLMMPENAGVAAAHLHLDAAVESTVAELRDRIHRAAAAITDNWSRKTQGHPLIDLQAVRLDASGAETSDVLSIADIRDALAQSRRIVLEAPAGRGKTTTLIQLAQRTRTGQIAFMIDLPAWVGTRRGVLEYLAGMPSFQSAGVAVNDLARVQASESFCFLLNGWNEIAESNSQDALAALRDLETAFPTSGIIVATRTHHLAPPLPGAIRLRLLRVSDRERSTYLSARLGDRASRLRELLEARVSLDDLTRTPLILSEVVSLFDAGAAIPTSKVGVLAAVLDIHERGEHPNALASAPLYGCQADYLEALALEMVSRGAVGLRESEARATVHAVSQQLVAANQIAGVPEPARLLASLTAHHVLERLDYPETAFRFEHHQFQELYAARYLGERLRNMKSRDAEATRQFAEDYVNRPAWAEPLRMAAEEIGRSTSEIPSPVITEAGRRLIEAALGVDPVFTGELVQLAGPSVWAEIGGVVARELRALYAMPESSCRQWALAAMLATGSNAFADILVPLLSSSDRQLRLRTYRLWPEFHATCLGADWPDQVKTWPEEARADLVSEALRNRHDRDIVSLVVADSSAAVKKAALSGLLWTRASMAATKVLESMSPEAFQDVAIKNGERLPASLKPRTIAALRQFVVDTPDPVARIRVALELIALGETDLDAVLKDALAALAPDALRSADYHVRQVLEHLRRSDGPWISEWVANQVAEGVLYAPEYWMQFATAIPRHVVERCRDRLEHEDLKYSRVDGLVAVIASQADATLAAELFSKIRALRHELESDADKPHEFERAILRQLETAFRALPGDVATVGLLSVAAGDAVDVAVSAGLLNRVARSDTRPLELLDDDLKARLRAYLKSGVDLLLQAPDWNGEQKVNLASSLAQVGESEDIDDVLRLIDADLERMCRSREAKAAGRRDPRISDVSWSSWYLAAVAQFDAGVADDAFLKLLVASDYAFSVAEHIARAFSPKPERTLDTTFRYDLVWEARSGGLPSLPDEKRRSRYASALTSEIDRLLTERETVTATGGIDFRLSELAKALAAVDGRRSAATVLQVLALPVDWNESRRVDAAERLMVNGVVVPWEVASHLLDSVIVRAERYGFQDSDKYTLRRILSLAVFTDQPALAMARIGEVAAKPWFAPYDWRELITALGESRSPEAGELLRALAATAHVFEQCADNFVNAFARLDTPLARRCLLGFVDPDVSGIAVVRMSHHEDLLFIRIADLANRDASIAARLRALSEADLPELHRYHLSKVLARIGTPDAFAANVNLIDDTRRPSIPPGTWEQTHEAFVERRPVGVNTYTQQGRSLNDARARLFHMISSDPKRSRSAFSLLTEIEVWRLEYGRPTEEPRHPDVRSGQPWPPKMRALGEVTDGTGQSTDAGPTLPD